MIDTITLDGATLVRLDRPPVNALDVELNQAIAARFNTLAGPVVLAGTGRCFSAGVDLRVLLDSGPAYTDRFLESLTAAFLAVFDYPAPVVAAVNGHALAGGCVIAMASDIRYMSGGTIGLTELAVGVPFPVSAIEICRHAMGTSADAASLSGEAVPAEEALRLGWIHAMAEPDELIDIAAARARALGTLAQDAYSFTKQQLHRATRDAIKNGADDDQRTAESWRSKETRARIAAFLAQLAR